MTSGHQASDHRSLTTWQTPSFATDWARNDVLADLLALPRATAAAVIAADRPEARLVVDVGSGPGAFLATLLDRMPDARGVWSDGSQAMEEQARDRLAPYGDRVDYRLVDMTALATAGLPTGVDAVVSSRALHHLVPDALAEFYAAAAELLAPGGWLVNLDHMSEDEPWDARLRAVRQELLPRPDPVASHPQEHRRPTLEQHVSAMEAAGIIEVELVWKSFFTCLVMGRTPAGG